MNNISKTILAAVGAVLFTAAPAIASAERVYFLVGTRHIYRIGHYQYDHVAERRQIEQDYADQVASDQAQYDQAIQSGTNPDEAGPQFNQDLADLATKRDQQLGALYENVDYERERHPELQIEGDGPYQVMAINFHWRGDFEVFENFYVYAPWPGYVVVDRPYGWTYGVVYRPSVFISVYGGWHTHYISEGRPVFMGGYGRHGYVHVYMRSNPSGGIYRAAGGGFRATRISPAYGHRDPSHVKTTMGLNHNPDNHYHQPVKGDGNGGSPYRKPNTPIVHGYKGPGDRSTPAPSRNLSESKYSGSRTPNSGSFSPNRGSNPSNFGNTSKQPTGREKTTGSFAPRQTSPRTNTPPPSSSNNRSSSSSPKKKG